MKKLGLIQPTAESGFNTKRTYEEVFGQEPPSSPGKVRKTVSNESSLDLPAGYLLIPHDRCVNNVLYEGEERCSDQESNDSSGDEETILVQRIRTKSRSQDRGMSRKSMTDFEYISESPEMQRKVSKNNSASLYNQEFTEKFLRFRTSGGPEVSRVEKSYQYDYSFNSSPNHYSQNGSSPHHSEQNYMEINNRPSPQRDTVSMLLENSSHLAKRPKRYQRPIVHVDDLVLPPSDNIAANCPSPSMMIESPMRTQDQVPEISNFSIPVEPVYNNTNHNELFNQDTYSPEIEEYMNCIVEPTTQIYDADSCIYLSDHTFDSPYLSDSFCTKSSLMEYSNL
eukprot:TRINITY_DN18_c0_g1_i2.p1 TRINITY_DN18_c0_g1~~TRINITY_DN18_c0_g1_i2.p1  ORF type:complete len:338 (+),score=61.63 TRINITY_DN18_c0_g1_i2:524-1537(+)